MDPGEALVLVLGGGGTVAIAGALREWLKGRAASQRSETIRGERIEIAQIEAATAVQKLLGDRLEALERSVAQCEEHRRADYERHAAERAADREQCAQEIDFLRAQLRAATGETAERLSRAFGDDDTAVRHLRVVQRSLTPPREFPPPADPDPTDGDPRP